MEKIIWEKLENIFVHTLEIEKLKINKSMSAADIREWDSLSHIKIIFSIESEFSIKFTTKEIMGFENIGDLYEAIKQKLEEN